MAVTWSALRVSYAMGGDGNSDNTRGPAPSGGLRARSGCHCQLPATALQLQHAPGDAGGKGMNIKQVLGRHYSLPFNCIIPLKLGWGTAWGKSSLIVLYELPISSSMCLSRLPYLQVLSGIEAQAGQAAAMHYNIQTKTPDFFTFNNLSSIFAQVPQAQEREQAKRRQRAVKMIQRAWRRRRWQRAVERSRAAGSRYRCIQGYIYVYL